MDYYKILEVDRNATEDDLKKAYLKLGLEEFDDTKFKILTQAFDVLSHPKRRAAYDLQYGEEGLKGQVPPRGAGLDRSNTDRFNGPDRFNGQVRPRGAGSDGPNRDRFNGQVRPRGAGSDGPNRDRFNGQVPPRGAGSDGSNRDRFNGQVPPRGAGWDGPNMDRFNRHSDPFDIFQEFFGSSGSYGGRHAPFSFRNNGARGYGGMSKRKRKGAPIERTLPCSLEELYNGTTKRMKISRNVTNATGRSTTISEILTINIMPGWKKGTKITFSEKGNEQHGVIPSDLVFIIDEKPHSVFKRNGDDLIATQEVSFAEAWTGYTAKFTTLDGRNLTIPFSSDNISPTYEKVIEGEGMPFSKEPTRKGDLRINFDIKFPPTTGLQL